MAQGDYLIQNQSFPSFRSDLNSTLEAINTSNSGTSRPSSAVAGTIWLDTTNATTPTLKLYDGTDDISLATFDYSANTVNWLDSTVSADLVNDLSPQLGAMLDVNGNAIGNGTEELIKFSETASAVNEVTVTNSATGNAPEISATGDDTNIDLKLTPKGTGKLVLDGLSYPSGDGLSGQFLKTDGAGNLSFGTAGGGKVLQVVSNSSSSTISTVSSSDIEVINTSITPSSTSSKILVIASLTISVTAGGNAYAGSKLRRGTNTGTILSEKAIGSSAGSDLIGFIEHTVLDSPSTTSSQQYTMSFRVASGSTSSISTDARVYNIILMEIGA
jgi:hypothetical protein